VITKNDVRVLKLYIVPSVFLILVLLYFPLIYSALLSLYKYSTAYVYLGKLFTGLKNYIDAFRDNEFVRSIFNTFLYTFFSIAFGMIIGIGIALLVNRKIRGMQLFCVLLFIPGVVSPIASGVIWKVMLNTDMGVIPWMFERVGFEDVSFLSNPFLAFVSLVVVGVWGSMPWVFILTLAGLQAIPDEVIEAAKLDGALGFRRFFAIILPMLKPVLVVVGTLRIMDAFRVFGIIHILTSGGPGGATESVSTYTFRVAFTYYETGYASALAFIIFIMIFWISALYLFITKPYKE
jgi:multiple sugar transport system permease protein